MRKPKRPPPVDELLHEAVSENRFQTLFGKAADPLVRGRYVHWDKLQYQPPPDDLSHREWWLALKLRRQTSYKLVPLRDKDGGPFRYLLTGPIPEILHQIDLGAGGVIQMPEQITNPETKNRYYVGSLIEEAITSSQLEGATTTRRVAKEMIRAGRALSQLSD